MTCVEINRHRNANDAMVQQTRRKISISTRVMTSRAVLTFMSIAPCMIVRSSSFRSPARNACEDAVAATDARRRVADRARAAI